MKTPWITPRTFEYLAGIAATFFLVAGLGFYALQEPVRLEHAQTLQLMVDLDAAMTLYAQNCSICHGLAGEGIGAMPALNTPALKEMDPDALAKTINRGLYGTAMPAWNLEDGGPLSDYQVSQLVRLVQAGDWQATQDRVVNLGLAPLVPFTTEPDPEMLISLAALPGGDTLANGITLYAQQCVACHGADGLGTPLAPALNDPAVREKPTEEIERIIRLGVTGTLMAGWEKTLTAEQIHSVLELIARWAEVPTGTLPAPDKPIAVTAESIELGSQMFTSYCSNCHGPTGQGSQRAPSLNVSGFLARTPDQAIEQIITLGVPGTSMPAWGDRIAPADIQAIVGFIRSWEPNAPEVAEPARVTGPWWRSLPAPIGQSPTPTQPPTHTPDPGLTPTEPVPASSEPLTQTAQTHPSPQTQSHAAPQAGQPQTNNQPGAANQAQGGPPWQQTTQPTPDQDWRPLAFLSGIGIFSLFMLLLGWLYLRKFTR